MRKVKNKKGFTLTELLIVIVLLVSILGTTIFGIEEIRKQSTEKSLNEIKKDIERATDIYFTNNPVFAKSLLNGEIEEKCTRLYVLQNEDLIDINLENPTTGERIPGNLCIKSRVENDVIVHKFEFE